MAIINNFKVFDENNANIQTDALYANDPQRIGGVVPGVAPSALHNKLYRQATIMTAALGQFIANRGFNASDADLAALIKSLDSALSIQNPNLLFNPTFRLGSNGWTGIGTNGFTVTSGGNADGAYLYNNTTVGVTVNSTKIPINPAIPVTLTGELYALGVTSGAVQLFITAYDVNNVSLGQSIIFATLGTDWTRYSQIYTTPANTSYITVSCQIATGSVINTSGAGWRRLKVEGGSFRTIFTDDSLNTFQFSNVLGLSQVVSGGYKEENGIANITTGAAVGTYSVSVTFPVAFGAMPQVFVTADSSAPDVVSAATTFNRTATGFTAYVRQTDATARTVPVNWCAKGV